MQRTQSKTVGKTSALGLCQSSNIVTENVSEITGDIFIQETSEKERHAYKVSSRAVTRDVKRQILPLKMSSNFQNTTT